MNLNRCRYCDAPATNLIVWHHSPWKQRLWWRRPRRFPVCAAHEMRPLDDRRRGIL